jgi:hypothetical protein
MSRLAAVCILIFFTSFARADVSDIDRERFSAFNATQEQISTLNYVRAKILGTQSDIHGLLLQAQSVKSECGQKAFSADKCKAELDSQYTQISSELGHLRLMIDDSEARTRLNRVAVDAIPILDLARQEISILVALQSSTLNLREKVGGVIAESEFEMSQSRVQHAQRGLDTQIRCSFDLPIATSLFLSVQSDLREGHRRSDGYFIARALRRLRDLNERLQWLDQNCKSQDSSRLRRSIGLIDVAANQSSLSSFLKSSCAQLGPEQNELKASCAQHRVSEELLYALHLNLNGGKP